MFIAFRITSSGLVLLSNFTHEVMDRDTYPTDRPGRAGSGDRDAGGDGDAPDQGRWGQAGHAGVWV